MRIALLAKNKLRFIYGSCKQEDYEEQLHSQWKRCNAFILSWILNTVNNELSTEIGFTSSVAHVWKDLKEQFHKVDGSHIFFLY